MASEITLVPDKQYLPESYGALTKVGGLATEEAAIADALDSTYLTTSFGTASGGRGNYVRRYWGFPSPAIPAGAIIEYIRGEWRESMPPNSDDNEGLAWAQGNVGIRQGTTYALSDATVVVARDNNVIYDRSTPNFVRDASGKPWARFGDLANFVVATTARAEDRSSDLNDPRLYQVRLALAYNERPVASAVGPTGTLATSRPTVTWSYSDPENDSQVYYRVKVFTSAQNDPGGATNAVYDSGWVRSSATRHALGLLANNTTFYAYVQVEQAQVAGLTHRSAWASTSFTVSVSPPPPVSVAVTKEESLGRYKVVVTEGGLPAAERYSVEHSLDSGLTWGPVRGATDVTFVGTGSASVTVYDYEVPLGVQPQYRARVVDVLGGGEEYASALTVSALAPALTPDKVWLKDLQVPANNTVVRLVGFNLARPRPEQVAYGVGASVASVSHDGRRGFEGQLPFRTNTRAEDVALNKLLDTGRTLLLQDVLGRQIYLSLGDANYEMQVTKSAPGESSPVGYRHVVSVKATEVDRPAG